MPFSMDKNICLYLGWLFFCGYNKVSWHEGCVEETVGERSPASWWRRSDAKACIEQKHVWVLDVMEESERVKCQRPEAELRKPKFAIVLVVKVIKRWMFLSIWSYWRWVHLTGSKLYLLSCAFLFTIGSINLMCVQCCELLKIKQHSAVLL